MKKLPFVVALGGLTILLALWMACSRPATPDILRIPKSEQPQTASLPDLERSLPGPSTPPAERTGRSIRPTGLWDRLSAVRGADAAITATAAHLAVESSSLPAFQEAARQSILELDQAQSLRQQEVTAPISSGLAREGRIEMSRQSDARYDASRRRALDRLEPFLDRRPEHLEFRREFETWASTMSATSQGVYR